MCNDIRFQHAVRVKLALPLCLILQERKVIKMKRDVGMACKKVHGQGKIKVIANIQSLIYPYIFLQQ